MSTIAILGNLEAPYSTESDLAWTLEHMGHKVLKLQENKLLTNEIVACARERGARLLIYVHTHGWDQVGTITTQQMIEQLRTTNIKTAGFHLDRFWDLNTLDQREERIGRDAFWKCDTVFTADGGNDERFKARGVNHIWLPPAVIERDCSFGTPQVGYNSPVAFAGAEGYHPEWPYRPRMVSRLREKYGSNFRVYQGIRGQDINNLYASARVMVGDSCFAGADKYWSDRVPEVLGRGGFLIFPKTPGLNIPGLVTYEPGNVDDLIKKTDYWIQDEVQAERKAIVTQTQAWVKTHDTYTNRLRFVLDYMGVK